MLWSAPKFPLQPKRRHFKVELLYAYSSLQKRLTRKAVNQLSGYGLSWEPNYSFWPILDPYLCGNWVPLQDQRWFGKLKSSSIKIAYEYDGCLSCWWAMSTQVCEQFLSDISSQSSCTAARRVEWTAAEIGPNSQKCCTSLIEALLLYQGLPTS